MGDLTYTYREKTDMEDEDYPGREAENERVCRECRASLDGFRKDAVFCGDACRKRHARHEKRLHDFRESYSSANPDVSFEDWYQNKDWSGWNNPRELVDEFEVQDREPGTFTDRWQLHEAEQAVRAAYDHLAEPYREQLRRNRGVKPKGLVDLERRRDQDIAEMWRTWERADELGRAAAIKSMRVVQAHERQTEQAALTALGNDRYGHRSGRIMQEFQGRATSDIWSW